MSWEREELSEPLRQRVAALHDQASAPLGSEAQLRLEARLRREAQRLRARRQQLRRVAQFGIALSIAAAALLAFRIGSSATHLARPAVAPPPSANGQPEVSCGLPQLTAAAIAKLPDARQRLDLAAYGELVAGVTTELQIEASSACELVLRLGHGTIGGDLHSLRPARLRILTADGEVLVTGTRFSVRAEDDFEVVLASGVVDVLFADRSQLRLQAGTSLHRAKHTTRNETRGITAADEQSLRQLLAITAPFPAADGGEKASEAVDARKPVPRAAIGKSSWLEQAEAARRAGRYAEAREAYRAATQRKDDAAEVAWLRWSRLELDARDPNAALAVLDAYRAHVSGGHLGAEAGWLEVQAWLAQHQPERARSAARRLVAAYADTPQAAAARRLLGSP